MKYLFYISLFILFSSCGGQKSEFDSQEAFDAYLNDADNGFIQSFESQDMLFETRLIPALKNEGEDQFTIQFRINRKDNGSVLDFDNVSKQEALTREGYLSFEVANDLSLETGAKTIPAIFHHYERNYGIKPSIDILIHFENFKPTSDVYFVYRDNLFNQGLIKIKYKKELFTSCHVKE